MNAPRKPEPEPDPKHDAESVAGAPERPTSRGTELDALFGDDGALAGRSDADVAGSRAQLAALFGQPSQAGAGPAPRTGDTAADLDSLFAPRESTVDPADEPIAWAPPAEQPGRAGFEERVEGISAATEQGGPVTASPLEPEPDWSDEPQNTGELLALLGLGDALDDDDDEIDESPSDDRDDMPGPIAATAVLPMGDRAEVASSDEATNPLPPFPTEVTEPVVAPPEDEPTRVLPAAAAVAVPADTTREPAGSFMPAQRRGIFAWSARMRWSVAASVVLLAAVVVGAAIFAQNLAANNQEAQALAAAVAELEAAETDATEPYALMQSAFADYDATVSSARAAADSAAPALASVVGMTDEAPLAAAEAARVALVAQLDDEALAPPPEAYERAEIDLTDLNQIAAATQTATNRAEVILTAIREAQAAQTALNEKIAALTAAQGALGSSLPATAVIIVGENPEAEQSFRDAVVAASVAVPAAQQAGRSGDAELLAYAAAVTALRTDEARAQDERPTTPVRPPSTAPAPVPEPVPEPPAPEPVPDPTPTEEPPEEDPPVVPTPAP